ncbi:broad specificity phosphatase PhoE [Fontibacillus solani]|uniref:Broad specificity phosphatase PhoE n=1 Tax=Fontibacillus solani TaxID=1572857 RepID=A0A7W3XRZ2_9BACL|nr:broad specificity phosphatase PhoE [Fontibacillus solani]
MDSTKIKDVLRNEEIEILISSPYERSILTIKDLAIGLNIEIVLEEDLRERQLVGEGSVITRKDFFLIRKENYMKTGIIRFQAESQVKMHKRGQ